ncbi:uncharacterized protein LOC133525825 [Cydia pomonella]|uniref:uncharacterized protein LOC133525825 n=1 Tax=Cydia pomonella TaxID=82600 RepID=UPI002ADE7139|nr:uncharacterized protein LOC133525825 [Cydia pomonella]
MAANYVNYHIEPFDGRDFDTFELQLQCLISLNNVPEDKKVALLITKITPKVLETLNHICAPAKPTEKSFTDLIKLLEDRYNKSTSIPVDRAEFRKCNQKAEESIEDYIIRLKKAAKKCNFKDFKDQVKEKLIDGVYSSLVKFELLKNGNQTLDELTTLARTVEAAWLQTKMKMPLEEPASSMFFVKRNTQSKPKQIPNKANRESTASASIYYAHFNSFVVHVPQPLQGTIECADFWP